MQKDSFFMLFLKVHYKVQNQKTQENIMNFLIELYKMNLSAEIISNFLIKPSMGNIHYLKSAIEFLTN